MRFIPILALMAIGCGPLIEEGPQVDVDADNDGDGWPSSSDCNDEDASIHPQANEICNAIDDDCNFLVDDNATDARVFYADQDGDGFGDDERAQTDCHAPSGTVPLGGDCDDGDEYINPAASEICNDKDDDCDGLKDDADDSIDARTQEQWYRDVDGDGWGDENAAGVAACERPTGSVSDNTDCNDDDGNAWPGAAESCGDADLNCDGDAGDVCESCLALLDGGETADGLYDIDPDGAGTAFASVQVYCDMTTDGGGWTMVQRTVWDWSDSKKLFTNYRSFYNGSVGDAAPGSAYRLAGQGWSLLNVDKDHMFVHRGRDSSSGRDCDPLFYLGTNGEYTITSAKMTITPIRADIPMISGPTFYATDGSNACPKAPYDAVPWFYSECCSTCPTFKGQYWADEAHPMVHYLSYSEDAFGQKASDVCRSGSSVSSLGYQGVNQMEYFLR